MSSRTHSFSDTNCFDLPGEDPGPRFLSEVWQLGALLRLKARELSCLSTLHQTAAGRGAF